MGHPLDRVTHGIGQDAGVLLERHEILAARTTLMSQDHDARASVDQRADRASCRGQAAGASHAALFDGRVDVAAHEHAVAMEVEVVQGGDAGATACRVVHAGR